MPAIVLQPIAEGGYDKEGYRQWKTEDRKAEVRAVGDQIPSDCN